MTTNSVTKLNVSKRCHQNQREQMQFLLAKIHPICSSITEDLTVLATFVFCLSRIWTLQKIKIKKDIWKLSIYSNKPTVFYKCSCKHNAFVSNTNYVVGFDSNMAVRAKKAILLRVASHLCIDKHNVLPQKLDELVRLNNLPNPI